ncbi:MAG: GtrA family protein, partial [Patescibacteria group bacterium]|nr:GtrA family protein [Patescibacteria group bacterium]
MSNIYKNCKNFFYSLSPGIYNRFKKYKLIIKYIISGGTAALVDLIFLYVFTDVFKIWYLISASLSFLIAYFVSFSMQKFWTFRDNGRETIYRQMYLYFIVGVVNLLINAGGMYLLVDEFGVMYILAQIIMGALLGFSSFLIYRFIIFEKKKIEAKKEKRGGLKILIATGIFPPDIGGPATYTKILGEELPKFGCEVTVIAYGDGEITNSERRIFRISRRQNIISRYLKYFRRVWELSGRADIVYAHDLVSVGLPCALVKLFKPRLKLVIRLGGDFLWEKAYNNGWTENPLSRYYKEPKNFTEKIFLLVYKFVLPRCDKIIFSTPWQKEIYEKYLKVKPDKALVIDNIFPEFFSPEERVRAGNRRVLLAGRLIKLKNFAKVFAAARELPEVILLVIGEGPEGENLKKLARELGINNRVNFKKKLAWPELAKEILGSFLVLVPSITEISPNLVLECLKLGQPVLVTKECGFYGKYKEELIFIDPFSENDIKEKIIYLLN